MDTSQLYNTTRNPCYNLSIKCYVRHVTNVSISSANDRGPDMEYSLNIQLINNAQTEDCIYKYKIILEKTADELKDLINKLICLGVLCQQTTQTFLTKLAIDRYQDNGANKAVCL